MEAITALLRVAARAAGATAALLARAGDDVPVAAWGCDGSVASALLRAAHRGPRGGRLAHTLPLRLADGSAGVMVLVAPAADVDAGEIAPLLPEIGALCDPAGTPEISDSLNILAESVEGLGDATAILLTPRTPDEATRFTYVNAEFSRLFGYGAELIGDDAEILLGPLTDREAMASLREQIAARRVARASTVLYGRDRAPHWVELVSTPVEHGADALHHVVAYRDVTSRKTIVDALAAERQKLQTTLAAITDAVTTILADGRIEYVNEAAERLLGVKLEELYGMHVADAIELVDADGSAIELAAPANARAPRRGAGHLRAAAGMIDVAYVASPIDAEDGGTVIVMRDVTHENRIAMRLSFEAAHDPLTGLPNRRAIVERLEEAVAGARERGEHHSIAFLDLDRFKVVNDRFGHAVGDRLLREVGRMMGRIVRNGDVLARIGGDEFALLLPNCRVEDALRVVEKTREAVEAYRIEHEGQALAVGVSIGVAAIDAETRSAEAALAAEDAACYLAKAAGRNAVSG
ncbi:hypothetical protein WPS_11640 [Vulcanimicrobium alpinum]|uniref:Diguanylate cyclase n=1 Tax=Vulcanimicrobium alpinum TaxID=3016050 RepID=A0AAN1XWZ6_UNVUL|nr:diguanylate cyclase [Vulcanimicrobium alpinum]BDE05888.1 hypothetical protein WPS_11640 [Vulcanimicrobium alpinum]